VNAGGLKRLQESGRKPQRQTVLVEDLRATPGGEFQETRLGERLAAEIVQKRRRGFVVADIFAAIDITVPDPVL